MIFYIFSYLIYLTYSVTCLETSLFFDSTCISAQLDSQCKLVHDVFLVHALKKQKRDSFYLNAVMKSSGKAIYQTCTQYVVLYQPLHPCTDVCAHLCHLSYISLSCFCLREHNQVALPQIKSVASL